jgi:hypothetical protein
MDHSLRITVIQNLSLSYFPAGPYNVYTLEISIPVNTESNIGTSVIIKVKEICLTAAMLAPRGRGGIVPTHS